MNEKSILTPKQLFNAFRDNRLETSKNAIAQFRELDPQKQKEFWKSTVDFLNCEEKDTVRSWGTTVLEALADAKSFHFLTTLLKEATDDQKRRYQWTRFFALRAIKKIAKTKHQRHELNKITKKIVKDKKEHGRVRVEAMILLTLHGQNEYETELKRISVDKNLGGRYWYNIFVLRGLQEFPLPNLVSNILDIVRECDYSAMQDRATRALAGYDDNPEVVRELGTVAQFNPYPHIRLSAVVSLAKIGNPVAKDDLLAALTDSNAEVRFQASMALKSLLPPEDAVSMIVEHALRETTTQDNRRQYIEAMRRIDPEREICTDVLEKEHGSEDRQRSKAAEQILIELGGWAAVQKISQLRNTLESLDKLLADSEQVVKSTFDETIHQAQFNFYFAMVVNALIVGIGLFLVVLAINHLTYDPQQLKEWIIPGSTGVFGILLSMFFNNPRKNARDDLRALMNVNVIFLGFLRQLNEIDATFKHSYITGVKFGIDKMEKTVTQINNTIKQTLEMAAQHLRFVKYHGEVKNATKQNK